VTQGNVNLKVVHDRLQLIEACLDDLKSAFPLSSLEEFTADRRNAAAAESMLRRAIQSIFDLVRHLVAKAYGRGLLEYRELARLARERGLIQDPHLADVLEKLAGYRNRLTHFYDEVTDQELYDILQNRLGDLEGIARELQRSAIRLSSGSC
jgi:uncharacterized protein YutE (UPF0331/DUF86 family)